MAKRIDPRRIKKHHNYTFEEAADRLGVHVQTVRSWGPKGLRILRSSTPHLILGDDLRDFLARHSNDRKRRLGPDEFYCLKCKGGRTPAGLMADYVPQDEHRGRLTGICPDCESLCHRFVRADRLNQIAPNLALSIQARMPSLREAEKAA